ncbi:MAG: lysylphosphatidylglycerol synthase domain-containing protein [Bacteroidota bacterium]
MLLKIRKRVTNTNVRKFLLSWIKLAITIAAFAYIIYTIYNIPKEEFANWIENLDFTFLSFLIIILTVLLSALNWYFESVKWKMLASSVQEISILAAFKSVLFGVSLGMITPKRLGEFAGRIMVLNRENRLKGLLLNTAASFSQLSVTLMFGIASILILFIMQQKPMEDSSFDMSFIVIISIIVLSLLLSILAFYRPIARIIAKKIKSKKWKDTVITLEYIKPSIAAKLVTLSIFRYVIFVIQFYFILTILGLDIGFIEVLILQSIIFLIMVILPISALAESGVKGSVTLLVFAAFPQFIDGFYETAALGASLGIWFVNLALPAVAGVLISIYEGVKIKLSV